MTRRILTGVSVLLLLALVGGGFAVLRPGNDMVRVKALFPRAVSLYVGNDVRILGVEVGTITSIEPRGTDVLVEFEYPASRKVPVDAKAVIVPPSIVSDRYIQLSPVYRSGATLKDNAMLGRDRTVAPLELDDIFGSLNQLNKALGPDGANKNGALSDLLAVSAKNLKGNGTALNSTLVEFSQAIQTLENNSDGLFGVIDNLSVFTEAVKQSDAQVRAVNGSLAAVSTQLNGERDELAAALKSLSLALGDIAGFVRDNKDVLSENVDELTSITSTILTQRRALEEAIDVAPLALQNLSFAYNKKFGTLDTRSNNNAALSPQNALCALLTSAGRPAADCAAVGGAITQIENGKLPAALPVGAAGRVTPTAPDLTLGGILEARR